MKNYIKLFRLIFVLIAIHFTSEKGFAVESNHLACQSPGAKVILGMIDDEVQSIGAQKQVLSGVLQLEPEYKADPSRLVQEAVNLDYGVNTDITNNRENPLYAGTTLDERACATKIKSESALFECARQLYKKMRLTSALEATWSEYGAFGKISANDSTDKSRKEMQFQSHFILQALDLQVKKWRALKTGVTEACVELHTPEKSRLGSKAGSTKANLPI